MKSIKKPIKTSIKIGALVLISTSLLTGCALGSPDYFSSIQDEMVIPSEADQKQPVEQNIKDISLGIVGLDTFDPLLTNSKDMISFLNILFDGLFYTTQNEKLQSSLARKYKYHEETNMLEIYLKPDIRWHDGSLLIAEDVVFTINLLKNQYDESGQLVSAAIPSRYAFKDDDFSHCEADTNDPLHVIFYDVKMDNDFMYKLIFPIVQPQSYQRAKSEAIEPNQQVEALLQGVGPFKLTNINQDSSITLTKNSDWYNGNIALNRIQAFFYQNRDDAISSFEQGKIDVITLMADTKSTLDYIAVEYDTYSYLTGNFEFLAINNEKQGPLQENAVRKALAYGIDRKEIVKVEYSNQAEMVDVPIHPINDLYWENSRIFDYSPKKAMELLDENGWIDINGDGYREKLIEGYTKERVKQEVELVIEERREQEIAAAMALAQAEDKEWSEDAFEFTDSFETERNLIGTIPLTIEILVNTENDLRRNAAKIMKNQLKMIGIEINIETKAWSNKAFKPLKEDEQAEDVQTALYENQFDIALVGYRSPIYADLSFIINEKTSLLGLKEEKYTTGTNLMNITNTSLLEEIEKTFAYQKQEDINQAYKRVQQQLIQELPIISLYYQTDVVMVNKRVRNINIGNEYDIYNDIHLWGQSLK